ncbi:MAG: RHS repeat-associated core domain-containing protein [Candidatus Methanofastidiosia archaeon]
MRTLRLSVLTVILFLGYVASTQGLEIQESVSSEKILAYQEELENIKTRSKVFTFLQDIDSKEQKSLSEKVGKQGFLSDEIEELEFFSEDSEPISSIYINLRQISHPSIHRCTNMEFDYEATSPYYKALFKDGAIRIDIAGGHIEFRLKENNLAASENTKTSIAEEPSVKENSISVGENTMHVSEIFEAVDLSYRVESSRIEEALTIKHFRSIERLIYGISWEGLTPEFKDDGSIIFSSDKPLLVIMPPSMTDAQGNVCRGLHYELIETENGFELHKVVDEKGSEWLKHAQYPVVIDPLVQTIEDAWESSGFTPYGKYFDNFQEHVNILNGHLIVSQTDLDIPGRGLNLVISRIYETPAVFYQAEPYDYTAPPVKIGMGWRLDIPYISEEYLYSWGGGIYKIEWSGNTFTNHTGSHFVLVKNADNTYTLTGANGTVCEFDTAGKITHIRDLDQNTITFNYSSGTLTSITDTIGRTATFSYSGGYLSTITYNGAEIEYGINGYGNLVWVDDFLDRRTTYSYDSGWTEWVYYGSGYALGENLYLLSEIVYPTGGYSRYEYDRFSYNDLYGGSSCLDYYKYYVTDQKVFETAQARHNMYSFYGNFDLIGDCDIIVKDEYDITQGRYDFSLDTSSGLIIQVAVENASETTIRKYAYTYDSQKQISEMEVYNDGTTLSYVNYYAYDDWGNLVYSKDAEGHEKFFSYAHTSTSGFFVDNNGTVIQNFTNAFSNDIVPDSVHTALLGTAEKQDGAHVKETYFAYDSEAHPTQEKDSFGSYTAWLTFSGTFNEKTGSTSFPIDLTGHTVVGNAVLRVAGLPSDDTYTETCSAQCSTNPSIRCTWNGGYWWGKYYSVLWMFCGFPPDCDSERVSIGPFTHYPGTLGYQSYTTNPSLGGKSNTFAVTTYWKAYPVQVQYNLDGSGWKTVATNLRNSTEQVPVLITDGTHTLNFTESSSQKTKFSWTLYVPVDNTPEPYITTTAYDAYGNAMSLTDPAGHTTTFGYSTDYGYAYMTSTTDALGHTASATYDSSTGRILSSTDPNGNTVTFEYDLLGRITKRIHADLSEVEAVYDDSNLIVTVYDELDHYTKMHYDKIGRLVQTDYYINDALYATEIFTYDYMDKQVSYTDPLLQTYYNEHDFLGRIVKTTKPDGTFKTTQYDDTNNVKTFLDENQHKTQHKYDWNHRLLWVKEFIDETTYYLTESTYNETGNLTSMTDANGNTTSCEYDALFGMTRALYPDSTTEIFAYDVLGNLTSYTDANGNTTSCEYNAVSQLISVDFPDESSVELEYDANGNRTSLVDPAGTSTYAYDNRSRLYQETRTINGTAYTIVRQFDMASREVATTYPEGTTITFVYDDLNRLISIPGYADFSYNVRSQVESVAYANGVQLSISYGPCCSQPTRFLATKSGTTLLDLIYTYDDADNTLEIEKYIFNPETQILENSVDQYTYDWLNRMVEASGDFGSLSYSYDSVGNRTSFNGTQYVYNSMSELASMSEGTTFAYDQNGNLVSKTNTHMWTYQYDYSNRLTEVGYDGQMIGQYTYDGDGRRVKKTEWSESMQAFQSRIYVYEGISVLYEKNIDAGMEALYIYGATGRIAKKTDGITYYYHNDHLGSPRIITDEDGDVVTGIDYLPFGESELKGESEDYLFTGKEEDVSELYYYGARYYDPAIGRFISRDPFRGVMSDPRSLNRYTYVLNNPLRNRDPWGEKPADDECSCESEVDDLLDLLAEAESSIEEYEGYLEQAYYLRDQYLSRVQWCDKAQDATSFNIVQSVPEFLLALGVTYFLGMFCWVERSGVESVDERIGYLERTISELTEDANELREKIKERCYCALPDDDGSGSTSSEDDGSGSSLPPGASRPDIFKC